MIAVCRKLYGAEVVVHRPHDALAGHVLEHAYGVPVVAHGDTCWNDHLTSPLG